ncbi:MAG: cation:proton antiporter [Sphingomonas sp.]
MEDAILLLIAGVAVIGVFGQWLGWRLRIPAIIPLLLIGALLGPIGGLIKPSAMLGEAMKPAIGMTVAIIVFEGGLNLNLRELRSAGAGVLRLVAIALPLNWLLGTLAGHYVGHLSWPVAILFGSILVVTGPTVIIPLLRQAKLEPRAAAFLKWEAIVNDPIGATLTLLILSYLTLTTQMSGLAAVLHLTWHALLGAGIAAVLGVAAPFGIRAAFQRDLVPEYLKTPILLAGALGVYAAGEAIQPETGLIGATLFGIALANIDITGLQELRRFKESLTVFLVSGLFILLTANIDPAVLRLVSWPLALTTLVVLFVARPAAIMIATIGAGMTWAERGLVSWIGPRGVVAAAVAGIAGERLAAAGYPDAKLVLPMVFAIIAATVLLHGFSLAPLARRIGLASGGPGGLLIVGASSFSIALGEALRTAGIPVIVADRSFTALRPARLAGLETLRAEILSVVGEEVADLRDIAYLLAATTDDAYNALVCTRFAPDLGRERVHQLVSTGESERDTAAREWRGRYIIAGDMGYDRIVDLMQSGAGFVMERAGPDGELPPPDTAEPSWPVALVRLNGTVDFFSPEQEPAISEGDLVLRFCRAAAPRRRQSRALLSRLRQRLATRPAASRA